MMKSYKKICSIIAVVVFLVVPLSSFAQNEEVYKQGNDLYNKGNYQEAVDKYLEVLEQGYHSAALYYNIGNAYYKLNQIAPSIYYYEKALLLAPNDKDILNNLKFAQNMTVDAIDELPQTALDKLFTGVIAFYTYATWGYIAIVGMLLFVLAFLLYYFANYHVRKRLYFVVSILFLLLTIVSFSFAYYQYKAEANKKTAIMFAQESSVMSEPNMRGTEVFLLHEGTKVSILETLGTWCKIKLSDGKTGWVQQTDLKGI